MSVLAIGGVASSPAQGTVARAASRFAQDLSQALSELNRTQLHASRLEQGLAAGRGNLEQVVVGALQATFTLDLAVAVQSRVISAYQTVMNMQL